MTNKRTINYFVINNSDEWNNITNTSEIDINIYLITKDLDIKNNTLNLENTVIIGVTQDTTINPIFATDSDETYYIPPDLTINKPGYFINGSKYSNLKGYKCQTRLIKFINPLFYSLDACTVGFFRFITSKDIQTTTNGGVFASQVLINSIINYVLLECNNDVSIKYFGQTYSGNGLFVGYNSGTVINSVLEVKNTKLISVIGNIIGGFIGINDISGVIDNCNLIIKNSREINLVSLTNFITGGFVGLNENVISKCVSNILSNEKFIITSRIDPLFPAQENSVTAGFVGFDLNSQTIDNKLIITNNDLVEFNSSETSSGFVAGGGSNVIANESLFLNNESVKIISNNSLGLNFAYADGFASALNNSTLFLNNTSTFKCNESVIIIGKFSSNFISNNANRSQYNKSFIKCNKSFIVNSVI